MFKTQHPENLLAAFWAGVASGEIAEWRRDSRGYVTQAAPRWSRQAWLHPIVTEDGLYFYTIPPEASVLSREIYAHYQARLVETFIAHLFDFYEEVSVTAHATRQEAA